MCVAYRQKLCVLLRSAVVVQDVQSERLYHSVWKAISCTERCCCLLCIRSTAVSKIRNGSKAGIVGTTCTLNALQWHHE